ncbi:MAG: hypothetical protein JWR51_4683 [Devosia sp.]|uniref:MucR family transcriptional regulator n=1 Tax=Devosia sp. TaxID=1871048 RepID=UPI0026215683|nr:MucR family transcriptional regulator [Devosia sp.]MDB5531580.1 hypothetical protein [Devosia sp.]
MFQTKEELEHYLGQPRIECLECGRRLKKLGVHLRAIHGVDPDDYREKHGIPYTVGLACPELRDKVREQVAAAATPERMKELQLRSVAKRQQVPNRHMADAPIIRKGHATTTAKMRSVMRENERKHGQSPAKKAAVMRNLQKAAAKIAEFGPSDKQRAAGSHYGKIYGPKFVDLALTALGRERRNDSPKIVAAVRADRATGLSWRKLEAKHGIPATSIQRMCEGVTPEGVRH